MGFLITANNVKHFAKALHCLCRLGNEVYMECKGTELKIKTWNASRSTFASFLFEGSFFQEFQSFTSSDGDDNDRYFICKVSSKTFLQVFRSVNFIERSVETCDAQLSDNGDQLVFTLHCKHAVVKTFHINYEECDPVQAIYAKDLSPNKINAPSKLFLEVISNFPTSVDEITLSVTPCKVVISSFTDKDEIGKVMSTEMTLDPKEFSYFQVGIDTCISFSLRDLRSILQFAESCGAECKMSFEYEGKPFVIEIILDSISSADFVLATIAGNSESQSTAESISRNNAAKREPATNISNKRRYSKNPEERNPFEDSKHFESNGCNVINNNKESEPPKALISDLLFAVPRPSQGLAKTILAADSDEDY